jgi:hypothetical protein
MRVWISALVVTLAALAVAPRPAAADAKKDIEVKVKEAMENYDLFEYEEARKLLNTALTLAKRNKLEANPVVARVHLSLGIVYFAGLKDEPSAKLAFMSAVEIDPKIQIEPAYRSAEMATLLDEARAEQTGSGAGPGPGPGPSADDVDCKKVSGVQHNIIDTGTMRSKIDMEAHVGNDVKAARIVIKFRPKGKEAFTEVEMSKEGDCRYTGAIPATGTTADLLHYYIAAIGDNGRDVASKGSEGSPNIVELAAATGGSSDSDNPLDKRNNGNGNKGNGNTISGGVVAGGKPSTVFVAVAVGTGAGYVTGETEQERNPVDCCVAPGLFHIDPEVGYFVSKQLAISLAARIGFPFGANIEGHATVGPAGMLKIRYALSERGNGFHVSGAVGGGIIRNTIKLTMESPDGGDTDIVALGPMLVGAGAGWVFGSGKLRFNAELNALAGIPVVKDLGESRLNFGVQFDLNLGVQVGF